MTPGDPLPEITRAVEAGAIVVMADILRDPNPLHLDPAAVAAAGLGDRPINQGPANLGYVVDMLCAALPNHRLVTLDSRCLANVRAGDVVTAGGTAVAVSAESVECEAWLKLPGGEIAVRVFASLVSRDKKER
jgi:acyl dehydratase